MNELTRQASDICSRCGKLTVKNSGSITQWISGCKCAELNDLESAGADQSRPTICATCGKKIESGRPGSLTQWVFRQDICSCRIGGTDLPAQFQNQDPSVEFGKELDTANNTTFTEDEIAVDKNKFPVQRYAPLGILGRGAAGTVYLCRDRILRQKVAVKCLNNLTPEQLLSFQMEAKATAKLNHPNIIKVINLDVTDSGAPYMVMEYFPSVSLAELIEENRGLAWAELYTVLMQIIDGLAYAHRSNIFHRDLKPSNILLQQRGATPQIRIIDFGVALVKTVSDATSQGRTLVGTPAYMSPDQVGGIAYDARSEIYSLGCLAFEAATGAPPFQGAGALELINQHANEAPPLLEDFTETEFPQGFHELITRMLEKDPNDRPQSIEDLRVLLSSESQTGMEGYERDQIDQVKPKIGKLQVVSAASLLLVGLLLFFLMPNQLNPAPSSKTDSIKRQNKDAALRKFMLRRVEFDEPGKLKLLVTRGDPNEQITDEDLQYISQVISPHCEGINLASFTGISGEGIKYLRNCKIRCINAAGMNLTAAGWKYLSEIKSLQEVVLERSNVTNDDLKHFEKHKSIFIVGLANCADITDGGVRSVAKLSHLEKLDLTNTKVTDDGLEALGRCPDLRRLFLEGTQIGDDGIRNLKHTPKLFDLHLLGCPNITDESLKYIAATWPDLSVLEIGGKTAIKSEDLEYLRPLKKLAHLNIVGVVVTDEAMEIIGTKAGLLELYISGGQVRNESLKHLYPLKHLRSLSLIGVADVSKEDLKRLKTHLPRCDVICPIKGNSTLPNQFTDMYNAESK